MRYGDYYKVIADDNIYAYVRSEINERILVVLNKGDKNTAANLVIPSVYNASKLVGLIDDSEVSIIESKASVELNGMSYGIFEIK